MHTVQSDLKLRSRSFTVKSPDRLPDLQDKIPPNVGMPEIEFAYDVNPKEGQRKQLVYCAHCGHPTHYKGYVVKWSNGCRCLVGKDCGAKHYGADFHAVEHQFKNERNRSIQLQRYDAIIAELPSVLRTVGEISSHPSLHQFERLCHRMRSEAPDVWSALLAVARKGELAVEELVRDIRAEERRAGFSRDDDSDEDEQNSEQENEKNQPIYTNVRRVLGAMNGGALFFAGKEVESVFRNEHQRLKSELQRLRNQSTGEWKTARLRSEIDDIIHSVQDLVTYESSMSAAPSFFSVENLKLISKWLNQTIGRSGRTEAKGRYLLFTPRHLNNPLVFGLPDDYQVPSGFETLREFRKRIAGTNSD